MNVEKTMLNYVKQRYNCNSIKQYLDYIIKHNLAAQEMKDLEKYFQPEEMDYVIEIIIKAVSNKNKEMLETVKSTTEDLISFQQKHPLK